MSNPDREQKGEDGIWHQAHLLKMAFRCMERVNPIKLRAVVMEKCRTSRRERKHIIKNLRAHPFYRMLCHLDGVKP